MKTNRIAVVVTVLLLAVVPNLHAAACSNASLRGTFGYSSQGFIPVTSDISPALFLPQAQTGLITFDGKGIVTSGTYTINTTDPAGGVSRGTFTGTYAVNSNCTGTFESHPDIGPLKTSMRCPYRGGHIDVESSIGKGNGSFPARRFSIFKHGFDSR